MRSVIYPMPLRMQHREIRATPIRKSNCPSAARLLVGEKYLSYFNVLQCYVKEGAMNRRP
jgi:hypothetical protein